MEFQQLRILIASPSDLPEEREAVRAAIYRWNDLHAESLGFMLHPLMWEYDAYPDSGDRPQAIVNRQLVDKADVLIGLFWTKLGTSTGEAESGTAEEIRRFVKAGKPAMLFRSKREITPDKVVPDQLEKLNAFLKEAYTWALVGEFSNPKELTDKVIEKLLFRLRDLKKNLADAKQSTLGVSEQDAALIQDKFLQDIYDDRWHMFQRATPLTTLTIVPVHPADPKIPITERSIGQLRERLSPMGSESGAFIPRQRSLLARYGSVPKEDTSLVELTNKGTVCAAYNWKAYFGGDSAILLLRKWETILLESIANYCHVLRDNGVKSDLWIGFSLVDLAGCRVKAFGTSEPFDFPPESAIISPFRVSADKDLTDEMKVPYFIRDQLDEFWRCFGKTHDPLFKSDGGFRWNN